MARRMKVRIAFTVEIDPEDWQLEFGVMPSEVREDVKSYVMQAALAQLVAVGMISEDS